MKKLICAGLFLLSSTACEISATLLIPGNASGNNLGVYSFNQAIVAKDFNPATGEMFVGLNNPNPAGGTSPGPYAISKFSPFQNYFGSATTNPIFQPIAPIAAQAATIDFLALANSFENTAPLLGYVITNSGQTIPPT